MKIRAMRGTVLVDEIVRGQRKVNNILLLDDDTQLAGIRPRWCRVHAVGHDIEDVKPGDWILVKHGNWTRSMDVILEEGQPRQPLWAINWPDGGLLVSDKPIGDTFAGYHGVPAVDNPL